MTFEIAKEFDIAYFVPAIFYNY